MLFRSDDNGKQYTDHIINLETDILEKYDDTIKSAFFDYLTELAEENDIPFEAIEEYCEEYLYEEYLQEEWQDIAEDILQGIFLNEELN